MFSYRVINNFHRLVTHKTSQILPYTSKLKTIICYSSAADSDSSNLKSFIPRKKQDLINIVKSKCSISYEEKDLKENYNMNIEEMEHLFNKQSDVLALPKSKMKNIQCLRHHSTVIYFIERIEKEYDILENFEYDEAELENILDYDDLQEKKRELRWKFMMKKSENYTIRKIHKMIKKKGIDNDTFSIGIAKGHRLLSEHVYKMCFSKEFGETHSKIVTDDPIVNQCLDCIEKGFIDFNGGHHAFCKHKPLKMSWI